jgi:hypothetical protein
MVGLVFSLSCRKKEDPLEMSQATIAFTDAAADDLTLFEVDVTGIVFHKYSGANVSVLSQSTRVDFACLEDFGELVVGLGLETGYYTGMTLTLDFTNAQAFLEGWTTAATLQDSDGQPLTGPVSVQIAFPPDSRPYVIPGRNHLFMLDLDMNQALESDTTNNIVKFTPVITAEVDPSNPKPILATGYIYSVDTGASSFIVENRTLSAQVIGRFTVLTDANTIFHVDGTPYQGSPGLTALDGLALDTRVWIQGVVDTTQRLLRATAVEAGSGTFGSGQDWVEGLITTRTAAGNPAILTVLGTSKDVSTGSRAFNTSHTIDVSASTIVLRRGVTNALTTDELNIGQRVLAFGTLTGTNLDATAATGVVRMIRSDVHGVVQSVGANTMTITAWRFGLRFMAAFNFNVGGTPEANAAAYTIDTTGLDTSGIAAGDRVRAIGRINPVGIPADDNFTAVSVVKKADVLLCKWITPSDTVLTATYPEISLDTTSTLFAFVDQGSLGQTILPNPGRIQPIGASPGWGLYLIFENNGVQLHFTFNALVDSLNARIGPTSKVASVVAVGTWDGVGQIFNASLVSVVLKP